MPHVAPLSDDNAPDAARAIFDGLKEKIGMVPNLYRTLGHLPEVLQETLDLSGAIKGSLDDRLRELAYLYASILNECHY